MIAPLSARRWAHMQRLRPGIGWMCDGASISLIHKLPGAFVFFFFFSKRFVLCLKHMNFDFRKILVHPIYVWMVHGLSP